jgi:hypothetical protein
MPKNRKWGTLSKEARARAARVGKRDYDLSRDAIRKRYNRGTYNPLARDPLKRVPREYRHRAIPAPDPAPDPAPGRGPGAAPTSGVDWQALAAENISRQLGDFAKYNDDAIVFYTEHMSAEVARIVALASQDELLSYAAPQPVKDKDGNYVAPPIELWGLPPNFTIKDVSVNINGEWHNIFWYH